MFARDVHDDVLIVTSDAWSVDSLRGRSCGRAVVGCVSQRLLTSGILDQGERSSLEQTVTRLRLQRDERAKIALQNDRKASALAREVGAVKTELEAVRIKGGSIRIPGKSRLLFRVEGGSWMFLIS